MQINNIKEIENNYQLQILVENENYKLIGMPFYNKSNKANFIRVFNEKLKLQWSHENPSKIIPLEAGGMAYNV